ncbi:hypothetical protein WJX84_000595 [Apatococcus fuscideae]|uniref:SMP domain-containing protein n=1 Tax=Apatococcus fuscideae TaxID=2026836 RepID=A0AAW1SK71_9CHLO
MTGEAPQEAVSTQGNAANPPNSNSGGDPVASSGTALPYHSRTHAESIQETMNEREAAAPQAKPFDKTKAEGDSELGQKMDKQHAAAQSTGAGQSDLKAAADAQKKEIFGSHSDASTNRAS